jgi:hypothetical protein
MPEQMYAVRITATGEVRDADGNLISSEPVEATLTLTADEVRKITGEN